MENERRKRIVFDYRDALRNRFIETKEGIIYKISAFLKNSERNYKKVMTKKQTLSQRPFKVSKHTKKYWQKSAKSAAFFLGDTHTHKLAFFPCKPRPMWAKQCKKLLMNTHISNLRTGPLLSGMKNCLADKFYRSLTSKCVQAPSHSSCHSDRTNGYI